MTAPAFGHRYTAIPDSGVVELHCGTCPDSARWEVGYHPSLDVLIEQARAHDVAEHDNDSGTAPLPEPEGGKWYVVLSTADVSLDVFAAGDEPARARIRNKLTGAACEMTFAQWEPFSEELGRGIARTYNLMHPGFETGLADAMQERHPGREVNLLTDDERPS